MIGLTGAHRTGKTTLAKAYSERTGIPFVQTSASGVFAKLGCDPKADYSFPERLAIQMAILEHLNGEYSKAGICFITDRTPLDAAAYTLADVTRASEGSIMYGRHIMRYLEDCIEVTNRHFTTIVVVQPGIELVEEEGKAPANPAYVEHIAQIIMGLVVDQRVQPCHYYIARHMLELEARIQSLHWAVGRSSERFQQTKNELAENGISFH
jgi:predicted ATPase